MKWLAAFLSFISVVVLTAVGLSFVGGLSNNDSVISLIVGLFTAAFIVFKYKDLSSELDFKKFDLITWALIFIFGVISFKAFLWVFYQKGNGYFVSSPNNLGDVALHINEILYFANHISFLPDSPIYYGSKLRYPFGIDLFNSVLLLAGLDLVKGLVWVGLLSSFATIVTLLMWGRGFALAGFLFNGGLAGFAFFKTLQFSDFQATLAWKNLFLSIFITQRGFLYAIPVGLLLLFSWRNKLYNNKKTNVLPLWIEVLLYSTLPIFHLHTFIYLSFLLGIWVLVLDNDRRKEVLKILGFSIVPATILTLLVTDFLSATSVIHFTPGWEVKENNPLTFWILNFGLFVPLVIYLLTELLSKEVDGVSGFSFERNKSTMFVLPAAFLFVVFIFVMFAPWEWDNIKLLVWSYLIILPFLWDELISKWKIYIKIAVCFILFCSGFISVIGGVNPSKGYEVIKFDEVHEVKNAIKDIPINSRFACLPSFNHPLIFTGRKLVLGYPGWIWSHGFNLSDAEKKVHSLMKSEDDWKEISKELKVDYIYWGYREDRKYPISKKSWERDSMLVAEGKWGKIYKISD